MENQSLNLRLIVCFTSMSYRSYSGAISSVHRAPREGRVQQVNVTHKARFFRYNVTQRKELERSTSGVSERASESDLIEPVFR